MFELNVVVDYEGMLEYARALERRGARRSIVEHCLKSMHQFLPASTAAEKTGCA